MVALEAKDELLARVVEKRRQVEQYMAASQPRRRRLLNVTIVGGTAAAALTAGPAAGGASFTAWLTSTFGLTSPAWQILCGAATFCSVAATVATQVARSQNLDEHITRAQGCRAKLEAVEIGLRTGHIDVPQATTEFLKCVEESSFLDVR